MKSTTKIKKADKNQPPYLGQEVLQHSQGNPNNAWDANHYVDFYNRIITELNFPAINNAGDPSCKVVNRPTSGLRIELRLKGQLVYLPIGGSEAYYNQIKLAKEFSDAAGKKKRMLGLLSSLHRYRNDAKWRKEQEKKLGQVKRGASFFNDILMSEMESILKENGLR